MSVIALSTSKVRWLAKGARNCVVLATKARPCIPMHHRGLSSRKLLIKPSQDNLSNNVTSHFVSRIKVVSQKLKKLWAFYPYFSLILVTTGYKPYHYDMAEASNHFRMD